MSVSIYRSHNAVAETGEITKQNAHKRVHALDIQSLMNIDLF